MIDRRRIWAISVTLLSILALIALAAGFNAFTFEPGRSFLVLGGDEGISLNENLQLGEGNSFLARIVGLLGTIIVVLLPVGIIFMIIDPHRRKRIITMTIQIIILYLAALGLKNSDSPDTVSELAALPEFAIESVEGNVAKCGEPGAQIAVCNIAPEWAVMLVSAGAVIALAVIGRFVYKRFLQPTALQQIAKDAQEALENMRAGEKLDDAIQRCYYEMSDTLRKEYAIQRSQAMTAREFERRLEQSGLPRINVRELTRLFEKVRYGDKSPSKSDERQAVECLTAILQAASTGGGA